MDGVLVIDKPSGMTSFDVVQRARRALKVKKVGHTGTLDPMATGVLPLCLGEATKIAQFITESTKAYDATLQLGATTDTLDADGKILEERPVPPMSAERLEQALEAFRGTFLQTPPMYSAVKVGGRRLYELARAGEEVERAAREVTVHELVLRDFSAAQVRLSVRCSKGFFVRVLAAELGEALGCCAHLTALRRTASGKLSVSDAVTLADLEAAFEASPPAWRPYLRPADTAIADWPALHLSAEDTARIIHGQPIPGSAEAGELVRAYDAAGEFFAILRLDPTKNAWRPLKVLA